MYSLNHSPSLFDAPGTEALTLQNILHILLTLFRNVDIS